MNVLPKNGEIEDGNINKYEIVKRVGVGFERGLNKNWEVQ